jgi:type IV pilus assembly protein PilC
MSKDKQQQFITKCALLLESGISLSETLEIMCALEKDKKVQQILSRILQNVQSGFSLSKSIQNNVSNFNETILVVMRLGEVSGSLPSSIRQACEIIEKRSEIRRKIINAMIYPSFIAAATLCMTLFLVMYIFPKIIPLFLSMNLKLPLLTRLVLALYKGMIAYGLRVTLVSSALLGVIIFFYMKNQFFKNKIHELKLKLPIFGLFYKKYIISQDFQIIGTLLERGQLLPNIFTHIKNSTKNNVFRNSYNQMHDIIKKGGLISSLIKSSILFPEIAYQMILIGERTGTLSHMFLHIHKVFSEEIDDTIKRFNTLIEPVLMIGMGILVGSIALSIILPIYEVTNHLQK